MSRRKEAALQDVITNDQGWETHIASATGFLTIVDVYQNWTGPCKSICTTLKRIKLENGSTILKFATACADDIQALEAYKNSPPEPSFRFYASGILVDICHGCDVPLLVKKINTQVTNEEQIASGMAIERKPYARPVSAKSSDSRVSVKNSDVSDNGTTEVGSGSAKQLCFVFITPSYIEFAEEIKDFLKTQGIEILTDRQHLITEDEIKTIYPDIINQDSGEAFVDYVTGHFDSENPGQSHCHLMILTRDSDTGIGITDQMMKLVGPGDQEQAKAEAPDSINAKYGNMTIWTSADTEMSNRAIGLLFEDFEAPSMSRRASMVQEQSNSMGMKYMIFGENSEDFQTQIQNYGCKIVDNAMSFESLEDGQKEIVQEDWKGKDCMVIDCARSFTTLQNFCEGVTDQNVFIVKF
jgi:hypothetical protein